MPWAAAIFNDMEERNMKINRWILVLLILAVPFGTGAQEKKGKGPDEYLRAQAFMNTQPAAQATATRLLTNPFGEVDGMLLNNGMLVTFPPHMGEQLAATVKPGDMVEVKGYPEMPGQIKGYVITNRGTGQSVVTLPKPSPAVKPPPHLRGVGLRELSAQGEIKNVRYGGKGEINGVILANGTIVRFPRHVSYQFAQLFQVGRSIAASGYGTENQYGRALEATALGPVGQTPQPIYQR